MQNNSSKNKCTSASHQQMVENAKNRLNFLQQLFTDLQAARKDGRADDVAFLEEQVYQNLREWKFELCTPSPASSLLVCIFLFYQRQLKLFASITCK